MSGLRPDQLDPIPPDGLLLHIGIHKTGTTALQSSLRMRRTQLAEHGVTYPRTTDSALLAGRSLLSAETGWGRSTSRADRLQVWERFVSEVQPLPGRVVVSTEVLCQSTAEQAVRVVNDLGPERVHVVFAVRRLADLLPSSWQQYLKTGISITYSSWLREMLAEAPDPSLTPSFWRRNDVPALVGRWAAIVGVGRVTVVVSDPARREQLPQTFEQLLGLPPGLLADVIEPTRSNRSLTAAEAELLRQLNGQAGSLLRSVDYVHLISTGGTRRLVEARSPDAEEERLALPPWAAERVMELSRIHVHALRTSGVSVVGDPDELLRPPQPKDQPVPTAVPIDAAAALTIGVLLKSGSKPGRAARAAGRRGQGPRSGQRAIALFPSGLRRQLGRWRRRLG